MKTTKKLAMGRGARGKQMAAESLGFVTRARVTQIMNLLNLAAPMQELLLTAEAYSLRKNRLTERQIRRVVDIVDWRHQQAEWESLAGSALPDSG